GHLIEIPERRKDGESDLVAGNLGSSCGPELLLHALCQPGQCVFLDAASLTRPADASNGLVAAERLGDIGPFHNGECELLECGESTLTLRALPPTPNCCAVLGSSAVHDAAVGMPTERTLHRDLPVCGQVTGFAPVDGLGIACASRSHNLWTSYSHVTTRSRASEYVDHNSWCN